MSLEESLESPRDMPSPQFVVSADVAWHSDVLPDGRETVVIGDVEALREYCHEQGDNPFGYRGTCGLCSCEGILRQFGIQVTEADVVAYAIAHGLCSNEGGPEFRGGTTPWDLVQILSDFGVPARHETAGTLEELARSLESGRGVIIGLNCGVLWDDANYDADYANHAVTPIGVARDPRSGQIQGFYVNDTGKGEAGRFVDAATVDEAWVTVGGKWVVTDGAHPRSEQRSAS